MSQTKHEVIYVRGAGQLRTRIRKYIAVRKARGVNLTITQAVLILLDRALEQEGIK